MKILYLDESGDHLLTRVDSQYPVFVLGGIIVDRQYASDVIAAALLDLKMHFFGNAEIVFHTADISRARNGFEALKNPIIRHEFLLALNRVVDELDFEVVACAFRKDSQSQPTADVYDDLYVDCFERLINMFCDSIGETSSGGIICAEKRGRELDLTLERTWINISRNGTVRTPSELIRNRIVDLVLKDKVLDVAGLQMADLVVSPIGRALIGKRTHTDFDVVRSKIHGFGSAQESDRFLVLP